MNIEKFYIDTLQNKTAFTPATKEQRDLLFQKIHEAGYEWNAEKKELKKIEQKPADVEPKFKAGDKIISTISNIPYYITEVCNGHYLTDVGCIIMFNAQDNFELVEQNPTWSEEDEKYLIYNIEQDYRDKLNNNPPESLRPYYNKVISLLKSRIPQIDVTDEELAEAKKEAYNEALGKIEYHNGEPTFDDGWSAAIWYLKKRNGRPQNTWKPSEEQIIDLEKAIDDFIPSSYKEIRVSLEKLLKQLKAL